MTLVEILPIIIYILLIILIIVGIILGIKFIITIDKINYLIDDVTKKVKTLDNVFNMFTLVNDKLGVLTGKVSELFINLFDKIMNFKRRKVEEDYE